MTILFVRATGCLLSKKENEKLNEFCNFFNFSHFCMLQEFFFVTCVKMGSNFSKTLREEEIEEIESETGCQSLLCCHSGISLTSQPFSHGKTDHETLQSLFELGQGKQRISWVRKKANRDRSIKFHRKRREDFQHIPEIAINPLGERIIDAFFEFVDLTYGGHRSLLSLFAARTMATASISKRESIFVNSFAFSPNFVPFRRRAPAICD